MTKRCVRLLNTMTNGNTSTESIIKEKLQKNFNPIQMAVHNDSPMHHTGQSSETHFRLFIVSSVFDDIPVVKVNGTIKILKPGKIFFTYNFPFVAPFICVNWITALDRQKVIVHHLTCILSSIQVDFKCSSCLG